MNKLKSFIGLAAMMTALAYSDSPSRKPTGPKETEEDRKKRETDALIKRFKAQGLKEFFYGESSLWALNKESADKKARKKGWKLE